MSAPFRTEARFILVLDQLPTKSDFYMCIHFRHGTSKIIHHYCRASHTGDAPVTSKKLRKYQRFGVQKLPKHRYLQCFVPSTFA